MIRSFNRNADGAYPVSGLLRAKDGKLYGTTSAGGVNSGGTIYRITPTGSFSILRHLSYADGAGPEGGLVQGPDGALYGTTYAGGTNGAGTIFKITTSGSFKVLHNFVASTEGSASHSGLVVSKDGNLYGVTGANTKFYKITKDGQFSVIKAFVSSSDGSNPFGSLIVGTDGAFYGTTSVGGTYNGGTAFKITTSGTITKLKQFNPTIDGGRPKGGLILRARTVLFTDQQAWAVRTGRAPFFASLPAHIRSLKY